MTMPYHKELLRSSVSLRFREFFVFRNKVKGVMTLLCQFEKMIYPSGTGAADATSFMIALYRPCEKLKDSSGNTITQIKAVGYCLPTASNMRYEMRGHWRKDPKYGIQYDVEGYEEQIIPTREGIVAYLSSGQIKGIGPKMAERIYDAFGNMALEVLDKKPEMLLTISGISQNKLKKICDSYLANRGARDVVAFLSPHGITPNRAVKLYKEYGEQTMDIVKNHPYKLCEMVGVGFKTADKIAMSMGIDRLSTERVDEGIAITVSPGKDCFVATAKVYPSYKDGAECYLAEATASRGYLADKPSVSPREWAQTAAVGIALRNAGFGLQFAMAGDEFEDTATDELNGNSAQAGGCTPHESSTVTPDSETEEEYTVEPTAPPQRELTFEEKVEQAMRVPCPITKYGGKTLGDVLQMDPKAIQWCATKFTGGEEIRNAAKLICEYAQQKASA